MGSLSQEPLPDYPQADGAEKDYTEISIAADNSLPMFNDSRTTAILCMIGLVFAWLIVTSCLVTALVFIKIPGRDANGLDFPMMALKWIPLRTTTAEALSFTINIFVGVITDSLGFIHGTSLRWALYRERRLQFNTNIRLFTSAQRNAPNCWLSNLFCIASLILCYAATSQLFVQNEFDYPSIGIWFNLMAIAALGLGLMIQAAVATWCIFSTLKETPTWSSNPLNNTLTRLNLADFAYTQERCMMSVHQRSVPAQKTRLLKKQRSPYTVRCSIKYILIFIWSLVVLAMAWAVATILVSQHLMHNWKPWHLTASWYVVGDINNVPFFMDPYANLGTGAYFCTTVQILCGILFTCAIQGAQTIGLHCIELLVNLSRDESVWRKAGFQRLMYMEEPSAKIEHNKKGARLEIPALEAAATSWEYCLLFILKALLHWLLGQSLQVSFDTEMTYCFNILYIRVFVYSLVAMVLAVFATYLAFQEPKGPQPAAWGHLQTLADLVDDWRTDEDGNLWWGDKGSNEDGTRHAGTCAERTGLGEIQMDAEYEGVSKYVRINQL